MRKKYKKKNRSCPLCKPHKMNLEIRWKKKDLDIIERSEKEMLNYDLKEES
jgi:hypothetical protein